MANKVTLNYDSLLKSVLPAMPEITPLVANLDLSSQKALKELMGASSIQNILSGKVIQSLTGPIEIGDLWRASKEAARAARHEQQGKAAAALEATADVLEEAEAEPPVEVLERALRPLFEEVIAAIKASRQQPSPWLMLILGCLLALALEILATQAGLLGK